MVSEHVRLDDAGDDAIAIIGMSGRFPGADSVEAFWDNLVQGRETTTRFSPEELAAAGLSEQVISDPDYVPVRGVIRAVEEFDAGFFGYSPREAELLDPQQRVFLEVAYGAIEQAGYNPFDCPGSVGVYAGENQNSYLLFNVIQSDEVLSGVHGLVINADKDFLATRVAYNLNLHGPAITVQCACSTSLVCVHMACQALLDGECDMAVAGGVSIVFPHAGYFHQKGGVMAPDGHCRPFDAKSQGTFGSDGAGAVLLKRLSDARRDGDQIHAVILGSAINNDGSDKASFAAPSVTGQAAVIVEAMAAAGVSPAAVGYVETHGTGTPLGDPVEVAALRRAYESMGALPEACVLGSLKSNFGHLDQAAGIANLIKAALVVQRGVLPPMLHFETPNPELDLDSTPFRISAEPGVWPAQQGPRVAGVSSFGFGGTNAHVIVAQAAPVVPETSPKPASNTGFEARRYRILPLSARSQQALDASLDGLAAWLRDHPEVSPADVAFTLEHGRPAFNRRAAVIAESASQAARVIDARQDGYVLTGQVLAEQPGVVFMFPGQGNQYPGMGQALYRQERVFRETVDQASEALRPVLGLDLRTLLYPAQGEEEAAARQLRETRFSQPALFVTGVAMARLWMSMGIEPAAMIGHSIGEWAAACMAGVFRFEDALHLVALRAQLMQAQLPGNMVAVTTSASNLEDLPVAGVEVAADNSPNLCVLTGAPEQIEAAVAWVRGQGYAVQQLHTSHAFHSAMMEGVLGPLEEAIAAVPRSRPTRRFVSNLTGTWITDEQACSPSYWTAHLRHTVRFRPGMAALLQEGPAVLLELGPGRTLSTFARQSEAYTSKHVVVTTMRHAQDAHRFGDDFVFAQALGSLWTCGLLPDWSVRQQPDDRAAQRIALPGYPFDRQRYYIEPRVLGSEISHQTFQGRLPVEKWLYARVWERQDPVFTPVSSVDDGGDGAGRDVVLAGMPQHLVDALHARVGTQTDMRFQAVASDRAEKGEGEPVADALRAHLQAGSDARPGQIVCWLDAFMPQASQEDLPQQAQSAQTGLLNLLSALPACAAAGDIRLMILTRDAVDLAGDGAASLSAAAVLGVMRAIQREWPGIRCRHVDVSGRATAQVVAAQLLDELRMPAWPDVPASAVWRGRHRYVDEFRRQPCPQLSGTVPDLSLEGALVLITGGTGEIGLMMARHFSLTHGARLLLVARTPLPSPEQWGTAMEDPAADEGMRRCLAELSRLQDAGVELMIRQVDVADAGALSAAVDEAVARFGPLRGVVHAAGISGETVFSRLQDTDAGVLERHWLAKVRGSLSLRQVVAEHDGVAFCLLQSSIFGALGVPGTGAYCAAGAWMDALAEWMQGAGGTAWLSLGWDAWLPPGMEVGAMAENAVHADEACRLIDSLISRGVAGHYLVSARDLDARMAAGTARAGGDDGAQEGERLYERPELDTDYVEPESKLEAAQAEVWAELLGLRQIGVMDDFFALGGHSLLATQLVARIQEKYPVSFQLHDLIDNPTPRKTAALLETRIIDMLEDMSDEKAEQMVEMLSA